MPKTTNKIWSVEEDIFLQQNYPYQSVNDLCVILRRTRDSVLSRASILQIKKELRKSRMQNQLNEFYFENIDSARKAYWYGFLWADASMYNLQFELTLQTRDKYIIEQFKNDIESSHNIVKHSKYNTQRFLITSKRFAYFLNKLNIGNRKSYTEHVPIIADEYFLNFVMGLFDGDGSFSRHGRVQIVNTLPVAAWLREKMKKLWDIDVNIYDIKNSVAKRINIQKQSHSKKLMEKLYNSNDFFMTRKYEKFDEFLKTYNKKHEL
jgi:hypothetical protein